MDDGRKQSGDSTHPLEEAARRRDESQAKKDDRAWKPGGYAGPVPAGRDEPERGDPAGAVPGGGAPAGNAGHADERKKP
jgi:hypothetical protein